MWPKIWEWPIWWLYIINGYTDKYYISSGLVLSALIFKRNLFQNASAMKWVVILNNMATTGIPKILVTCPIENCFKPNLNKTLKMLG